MNKQTAHGLARAIYELDHAMWNNTEQSFAAEIADIRFRLSGLFRKSGYEYAGQGMRIHVRKVRA
jgi:hypothetical protein